MTDERFAGNSAINRRIHACLSRIHPDDADNFRRKFRSQPPKQAAHTFRELLVGAYLAQVGAIARYDRQIRGKTPDWSVFGIANSLIGIIELATFHQTAEIDLAIGEAWRVGKVWCDWMPGNAPRLYRKLQEKAERYANLAAQEDVPYVVSVFGEFTASVEQGELLDALFSLHGGAFSQFPWLADVLYFQESAAGYAFQYFANRNQARQFELPDVVI